MRNNVEQRIGTAKGNCTESFYVNEVWREMMNHAGNGEGYLVGTIAVRKSPKFHRSHCQWVPYNFEYLLARGEVD